MSTGHRKPGDSGKGTVVGRYRQDGKGDTLAG